MPCLRRIENTFGGKDNELKINISHYNMIRVKVINRKNDIFSSSIRLSFDSTTDHTSLLGRKIQSNPIDRKILREKKYRIIIIITMIFESSHSSLDAAVPIKPPMQRDPSSYSKSNSLRRSLALAVSVGRLIKMLWDGSGKYPRAGPCSIRRRMAAAMSRVFPSIPASSAYQGWMTEGTSSRSFVAMGTSARPYRTIDNGSVQSNRSKNSIQFNREIRKRIQSVEPTDSINISLFLLLELLSIINNQGITIDIQLGFK